MKAKLFAFAILCSTMSTAQRVGINTAQPLQTLHINGGLTLEGNAFNDGGVSNAIYFRTTNVSPNVQFYSFGIRHGANMFSILANKALNPIDSSTLERAITLLRTNQRVFTGIGTEAPDMALQVAGTPQIAGGSLISTQLISNFSASSRSGIAFRTADKFIGSIKGMGVSDTGTRVGIQVGLGTNETTFYERLSVLSSGRVGINTTAPNAVLHVVSNDDAVSTSLLLDNTTSLAPGLATNIYFRSGGNYSGAIRSRIDSVVNGLSYGSIDFYTNSASSSASLIQRMVINDVGNVGIGTNSPGHTLDVQGSFRLRGNGAAAGKVLTSDANGVASWKASQKESAIFVAMTGASQTVVANTQYTVPLRSDAAGAYDNTGGLWDNTLNRFVASETGLYWVSLNMGWTAITLVNSANHPQISASVRGSGSTYFLRSVQELVPLPGNVYTQSVSGLVRLNAGDFLSVEASHTGSTNISAMANINFTNLSIMKL